MISIKKKLHGKSVKRNLRYLFVYKFSNPSSNVITNKFINKKNKQIKFQTKLNLESG